MGGLSPPDALRSSEEKLEAEAHVARVARRLNRVGLQRAIYRSAAAVLAAATGAAAGAAWLGPAAFRALAAGLALAALAVVAASLVGLRRGWAGRLEAARWVEARVPLEDRLLTLVSAGEEARLARLWAELVADNESHLERWRNQRLGIPRVPASALWLVGASLLAALFLLPLRGTEDGAALASRAERRSEAGEQRARGGGPPAGAPLARTGPRPGGEERPGATAERLALSSVEAVQAGLRDAFRRSFGGRLAGAGEEEEREEALAFRADQPEPGIGETEAQKGGVTPPEGLARLEDAPASGPSVKRLQPGGDGRAGGGGRARRSRPAPAGEGSGAGSAGARRDGKAGGPLAASEQAGGTARGSGGRGPGAAPATDPLLADAPFAAGGGARRRFVLRLGGAAERAGGEKQGGIEERPRSRIARAELGPDQAPEERVVREEIPAEYEAVVKRIFERKP